MKNDYRIIAIKEMCNGNATIGSMWLETMSFDKNAKISEVYEWGRDKRHEGKLIITIDELTEKNNQQ